MGQPRYNAILLRLDSLARSSLEFARNLSRNNRQSPKLCPHITCRAVWTRTYTAVRSKLAHAGWKRARIRLEWVKRGPDSFPGGTSQPYPGLSSVALIYVLVSDVTRVRPLYSRRAAAAAVPLVCAQRILRHIIPGVAYINDRNWDLLCLSSAREILRADLLSLPSVASPFLSRLHLIVKYSAWPTARFLLREELISIVQTVVNMMICSEMKDSLNNFIIISRPSGHSWRVHL